MLVVTHEPGWMAPAEFEDSIQGHVNNLTEMQKSFLSGSRAINPQTLLRSPQWSS
jgi:hypothetical protein